jgi:hypothetical protein
VSVKAIVKRADAVRAAASHCQATIGRYSRSRIPAALLFRTQCERSAVDAGRGLRRARRAETRPTSVRHLGPFGSAGSAICAAVVGPAVTRRPCRAGRGGHARRATGCWRRAAAPASARDAAVAARPSSVIAASLTSWAGCGADADARIADAAHRGCVRSRRRLVVRRNGRAAPGDAHDQCTELSRGPGVTICNS